MRYLEFCSPCTGDEQGKNDLMPNRMEVDCMLMKTGFHALEEEF